MDKVLKQRLIGATILIALAVIFLPMLFDGGDGDSTPRQLALDLPERPEAQREVRRLPLDPDQVRTPREAEAEPPIEPEADPVDEPVDEPELHAPVEDEQEPMPVEPGPAPEPDPEPEQELDTQPEPAPGSEVAQTVTDGNWVVQVAVFSNRDSAERIGSQLEGLGHTVMLDPLVRDQAELHRLRTGPYGTREDAETARGQIVATVTGVDPVVRALGPGEADESVERAGYAVQVGSFASRNNADRLLAQLLDQDFETFIHSEQSGGRTIYRVRVGSLAHREDAEALQERLLDEAGLEGIVVSHP